MINLSIAQSIIVHSHVDQAIMVLASAGSGKTRVLTERVRYIIENTQKDGVIALTFTNKAAEEMQNRLSDLEGLQDRCWIATIHAVAQRVLEQYGYTIGLPSELHIYERDLDRKTVFIQSLRENGIDVDAFLNVPDERTRKDRERVVQSYMEHFSIIKRELLNEEEIKEKYASNEKFWQIFQAYQQALLESGGIDFDDILVYSHRIILEQPWCGQIYRAKFKHICVDEAQDLNKAQYEFIKALCGEQIKSIMMVGDPNQMIYGFNGSSHEYLCQSFVADFKPKLYELKENYRSSKAVVHLSNKLKPGSQIESGFALNGESHIEEQQDEKAEALWVYNKITKLIQIETHPDIEGNISLDKMVVIARNRFVFKPLELLLKEKHIHYSLKRSERQIEPSSVFGKVLDLAIRLRLNPKDWIDGKKLCTVLQINIPDKWGEELLLERFANDMHNTNTQFRNIYKQLLMAIQLLDIERPNIPKFCRDFEEALKNLDLDNRIDEEMEHSLQELKDFKNCWITFRRKGLGESLSSFRNAMALGQLAEEYNPHGLTLSTVHTMKGLEKDIVFLIGMCEGVFPDYRARNAKEVEEERNNAFVAITRARRWIYITYPKVREMPWGDIKPQTISRFIQELKER